MIKAIFTGKNLIIVAAVVFAAAMVTFPEVTGAGTKTAISIWLNSVVPVLLPFFIFADFFKSVVSLERLPFRVYPLVMAFLSGYPMGAKITGDLVKEGIVKREEGLHILSYSLVTGPAFILGVVGAFIGNQQAAAIVALAHYAGALCNGALWKDTQKRTAEYISSDIFSGKKTANNFFDSFTSSILAGFRAMAIILAYLMSFMICAGMIEKTGAFDFLPGEVWRSFTKGLMEMTMGTGAVGMCNISIGLKTVLITFLISFGGLSVIGQSISVAGSGWLKMSSLVKIKLTHGLLSGIMAEIMIILGNIVFQGRFMV